MKRIVILAVSVCIILSAAFSGCTSLRTPIERQVIAADVEI